MADSLKKLRDIRIAPQFAQICKDYPEYEELRTQQRAFEEIHKRLLEKINVDIRNKSLKADSLIRSLFGAANHLEISPAILESARLRYDIGNPPGKKKSLGDPINWEALISFMPAGQHLHFVSGDGDYCSDLDDSRFDPFLAEEWESKKNSKIIWVFRKICGYNPIDS